jgi:DNA-binding response OmpR family regulator
MTAHGQHPHVLVIDDALMILDLKEDILESEGYLVSTMRRQGTGVSEIIALNPDLLVMAYIPRKDSPLLDNLAADSRTREIPVLLCTGSARERGEIVPRVDKVGVRFISKPFDIDDFLAAVHGLIDEAIGTGQT